MRFSSILIVVALLCGAVSLIAQESETSSGGHEITTPDGVTHEIFSTVDHGFSLNDHYSRPDMSPNGPGGVDHADRSVAGGNSVNHVDPYPALTAANNAYNQSVAAWQRANNSYQQALAEQEAIRDKYVDAATNTVRPGYDYYTAETVVRSADDKVQDAWLELDQATKARNEANSRAAGEFTRAMEQYYNSGGGTTGGHGASASAGSPSQTPATQVTTRASDKFDHH